jgi:hypothetical protein
VVKGLLAGWSPPAAIETRGLLKREAGLPPRITGYTRAKMRRRHIPEFVVLDVYGEPDGAYEDAAEHGPDREIRWRVYDAQRVEIVVDLVDDTIVSVWITQVNR